MGDAALQTIYRAVVVVKLLYAAIASRFKKPRFCKKKPNPLGFF